MILQPALEVHLWDHQGCVSLHCSGCLPRQYKHAYLAFCHSSPPFDKMTSTHSLAVLQSLHNPKTPSDSLTTPSMEPEQRAAPHSFCDCGQQRLTWTRITVVMNILLFAGDRHYGHSLRGRKHAESRFFKITPVLDGAKEQNEQIKIQKYTEYDLVAISWCYKKIKERQKSSQGEDIEDADRGCRCTSVVKMTK